MIKYNIEGVPKPRMTRADSWKKRPIVVRYWAYKDKLKELKVILPIPCSIKFELEMPKSWSKKKRIQMSGKPHESKPDIDNLIKGLFDAVFDKDETIWSVYAEKRWAEIPSITIAKINILEI